MNLSVFLKVPLNLHQANMEYIDRLKTMDTSVS